MKTITGEERSHLRARLLSLVEEEDNQIAIQRAVVISKIARFDYPKAWPSLFVELTAYLPSTQEMERLNTSRSTGALLVLHHVLKELSSKRLAVDQRMFQAITSQLIEPVWARWTIDTTKLIAGLQECTAMGGGQESPAALLLLERWALEMKVLRRMLLFGYPNDLLTLESVQAIVQAAPIFLHALVSLSDQHLLLEENQLKALLDRAVIKLMKTLRELQEAYPWSMFQSGALLHLLGHCCQRLLGLNDHCHGNHKLINTEMNRQMLQFIANVVTCASYKGSSSILNLKVGARLQLNTLQSLAQQVKPSFEAFWGNGLREALCMSLVQNIFPLTDSELEEWENCPENFHHELTHMAWEESVRGCAEKTCLGLLESSRDSVAPCIVQMLHAAHAACLNAPSIHSTGVPYRRNVALPVLHKAAVYNSIALGAYELHNYLDSKSMLQEVVLKEAQACEPAVKPLRRAALYIMSCLDTDADKGPIYETLLMGLQDQDAAISLTSVASLSSLIDSWGFHEERFIEFIRPILTSLATLMTTLTEMDSHLQVFALINLIIDRLSDNVKPHMPGLLSLLPSVWHKAGGQSLLRIQVLVALQRIIFVLGDESPMSYPLLCPLIYEYTDPSQPDELNMLEDTLLLWLSSLRCAPEPDPGLLLKPFSNLVAVMSKSTEYISLCMRIAFSAVLLGKKEFLESQGTALAEMLDWLVGNVNERGVATILPVVDIILQVADSSQGPQLLSPVLMKLLHQCLKDEDNSVSSSHKYGIFARLLLINSVAFCQLFSSAAMIGSLHTISLRFHSSVAEDPSSYLLSLFVDRWIEKFDAIPTRNGRRLSALALSAMLALPLPGLLDKLEAILGIVTGVWCESKNREFEFYDITPKDEWGAGTEDAACEVVRKKACGERDIIQGLHIDAFVVEQLNRASEYHGRERLQNCMQRCSEDLKKQVELLLKPAN